MKDLKTILEIIHIIVKVIEKLFDMFRKMKDERKEKNNRKIITTNLNPESGKVTSNEKRQPTDRES